MLLLEALSPEVKLLVPHTRERMFLRISFEKIPTSQSVSIIEHFISLINKLTFYGVGG